MKMKNYCMWGCIGVMILSVFLFGSSAVGAEEIRIGIVSPMKFLTGDIHWKSATMATEEINAQGGILVGKNKRKIKLFKADSNELLSVVDAVNAVERLISFNNVDFLMGSVRSEAAIAMLERAANAKKIFMTMGAASPVIPNKLVKNYDHYKYWFRGASSNAIFQIKYVFIHLEMVARNIRERLGIQRPKVAVVAEKALWADPIVAIAKKNLPKMGMEFVGAWRPSASAMDLSAELAAVKRSGAQVIMFFAAGPVDLTISRQVGEMKIPAVVIGTSVDATTQDHWKATYGNCNYRVIGNTSGKVAITEKTIPFYSRYNKRFGEFPAQYTCDVYDSFFVLKNAIEKAGTIDSDAVVAELEKTSFPGTAGIYAFYPKKAKFPHDKVFDPEHRPVLATQWQDGDLVVVWPDGQSVTGEKGWGGVRYEGTKDFKLPPWMIEYWKNRK